MTIYSIYIKATRKKILQKYPKRRRKKKRKKKRKRRSNWKKKRKRKKKKKRKKKMMNYLHLKKAKNRNLRTKTLRGTRMVGPTRPLPPNKNKIIHHNSQNRLTSYRNRKKKNKMNYHHLIAMKMMKTMKMTRKI